MRRPTGQGCQRAFGENAVIGIAKYRGIYLGNSRNAFADAMLTAAPYDAVQMAYLIELSRIAPDGLSRDAKRLGQLVHLQIRIRFQNGQYPVMAQFLARLGCSHGRNSHFEFPDSHRFANEIMTDNPL